MPKGLYLNQIVQLRHWGTTIVAQWPSLGPAILYVPLIGVRIEIIYGQGAKRDCGRI